MLSMAAHIGANGIGIMLSGMGRDGAGGMLAMLKAGARTMVDVMWAIRGFDVGAAAKAIQVPATILYGKRGPTIAGQERFKAAAPHIPIQVLEDSGHFPMLDQPAAFAEILTSFVSKNTAK